MRRYKQEVYQAFPIRDNNKESIEHIRSVKIMEDTIKKTIVIISFSKGLTSKNNPDYSFDICVSELWRSESSAKSTTARTK